MKVFAFLAAYAMASAAVITTASAQETRKWTDIDCSQSKIVAVSGLKCRATQVYSGSDSKIVGADAQGRFQRWISYGTMPDGSRMFFYASEGADTRSFTRPTATLEDVVKGFNRDFQAASNFTQLAQLNGGDYQRFTNPKGDACVAIRKLGDNHAGGFKWYLVAGKCAASGATISDSEIPQFLEATQFRG